jgi:glutamyl-tRNA reductase
MSKSNIIQTCEAEKNQLGSLQTKRTQVRDENKKMASWLLERSRRLMIKYLMRAANSSMEDGFKNWLSVLKHTKKKERVCHNIIKRITEK